MVKWGGFRLSPGRQFSGKVTWVRRDGIGSQEMDFGGELAGAICKNPEEGASLLNSPQGWQVSAAEG